MMCVLHIQGWDETEAETLSGPVVLVFEAPHHPLPHILQGTDARI